MSENTIANVGNVPMDLGNRVTKPAPQATNEVPVEMVVQRQESKPRETKVEQPKAEKAAFKTGEVSLEFKVDSESQDVTILILDRTSRKVVRTIPPEEMSNMDPGELLQLFA